MYTQIPLLDPLFEVILGLGSAQCGCIKLHTVLTFALPDLGERDMCPPPSGFIFIFMQVLAK